ncbi:MAG: hypothetical protein OEU92_17415 [Alphaproteobacteria bacterium]|nr:hypothetical protein [Alphaproteobacteria bacterium]
MKKLAIIGFVLLIFGCSQEEAGTPSGGGPGGEVPIEDEGAPGGGLPEGVDDGVPDGGGFTEYPGQTEDEEQVTPPTWLEPSAGGVLGEPASSEPAH